MGSSSQTQLDVILGKFTKVRLYRQQVAHEGVGSDVLGGPAWKHMPEQHMSRMFAKLYI